MSKTIKLVCVIMTILICMSSFYGCVNSEETASNVIGTWVSDDCANSEETASNVIGTWVSYDWGDYETSGIELTIKSDGTGSRYFYDALHSGAESVAGSKGWAWDCEGSVLICAIGGDHEFRLEYDATNDTLVEKNGRRIRTFTRKNES